MSSQVVSRKRVSDHGEVYTHVREVNAMLDLVKQETERIDSRFLEPACGNGNFLANVLERKLSVVEKKYKRSQTEYERYAILALSSIYGIEILEDNVKECRERLLGIFTNRYIKNYKKKLKPSFLKSAEFILDRNIIWGDALSLKTPDQKAEPVIFSEWSPVNGGMMKRRDFMLSFLLDKSHQFALFNDEDNLANIAEPVKDFPLKHFLKLGYK